MSSARPGLLLAEDLIFISRIVGTARDLGLEMRSYRTAAQILEQAGKEKPACVLVDLQHPGLDIGELVRGLRAVGNCWIVGYGSHVDTATLKNARAAGCDLVLPRSKFVEDLATALPEWYEEV